MEPPPANATDASRRRPTMRDVARLAGGVHPSTVSLVLRNSPNISEATRKKVMAAVRKAGYRRDPLLDAYNMHRTGLLPHKSELVVAWVSDLEGREVLERSEPFASYFRGARCAAESLHCKLEPFFLGRQKLSSERLNSILLARGISAMVVMSLSRRTESLALAWNEYSSVKIESPHLPCPSFTVASDHRRNIRQAMRALAMEGRSRIGLILQSTTSLVDLDFMLSGYLLAQSGLPPMDCLAPLDIGAELDPRVIKAWIREQRPDAVLVEQGSLLPRLRVVLGEGLPLLPMDCVSSLVGVSVAGGFAPDYHRVGAQAVEQLVSLMRANQRGVGQAASTTYVPGSWVAENSLGNASA